MTLRPGVFLSVALVAATGSGCYRSAPQPGSRPTSEVATSSAANPGVERCEPQDGRRIEIHAGTISCAQAYSTAASYDLQGEKYQEIGLFNCYTGTAQTAPMLLVCSSGGVEFSVFRA
ncbi:hypothetical protein [Mycolicibacterium sp.]|jgi:hypothetical protein|uniref:hypothetical protein n=1 Tax=Mycolicibacterium sp. TaxID=2320850 RepID=UPI0028ADD1EC|nr:hypothetical protein [Mycolicibacterium sp.]